VSEPARPTSLDGPAIKATPRRADSPATEMLELTRPECLRLLGATSLGRVVVNVPGRDRPVIRPVNYVFDEPSQSVLIRSAPGSKLKAVLRSARAVFEIDGAHPDGRTGGSVILSGIAEEITNEPELRRMEQLDLEPLAPGHQGHWIRIRANTVSGRRIEFVSD
jgi:nitroimidazol reductase NimA-like FMN-containing flavoprotein (pyridoxamine 5'-phosphate oxidase superfamily)